MQIKKKRNALQLNGLVGLGFGAAICPVNFAIVATCLRELVVRLGICHVLLDAVE